MFAKTRSAPPLWRELITNAIFNALVVACCALSYTLGRFFWPGSCAWPLRSPSTQGQATVTCPTPRAFVTAVARNNPQCNRLVNEQTEVSLLLVGPGIFLTLAFAPVVIHLFYTASFEPAIVLLRWFALGLLLRVISWPLGLIILAKGLGSLFICTEFISNIVYAALVALGLRYLGLVGSAVAFVGLYLFALPLVALVAWKLTGFRWSKRSLRYGAGICGGALIVFALSFVVRDSSLAAIGSTGAVAFGIFSLRRLTVTLRGTRFEPYLLRFAPRWLHCISAE